MSYDVRRLSKQFAKDISLSVCNLPEVASKNPKLLTSFRKQLSFNTIYETITASHDHGLMYMAQMILTVHKEIRRDIENGAIKDYAEAYDLLEGEMELLLKASIDSLNSNFKKTTVRFFKVPSSIEDIKERKAYWSMDRDAVANNGTNNEVQ